MNGIVPQIIGILAVLLFLLSYQMKNRRGIIATNALSRVLYILQYLLLGAYSGAVLDIFGTVSSVLAGKKHKGFIRRHTRLVFFSVNVAVVLAGCVIALINQSLFDILPIIGVLLHTSAFWINDEKSIRRVSLTGSPFWFVYNFLSRAYGSAVGDILTMVSIVIAMIKYRKTGVEDDKRTA